MPDKPLHVFISYAHESEDLRQQVWELAEYLRSQGLCVLTAPLPKPRAARRLARLDAARH